MEWPTRIVTSIADHWDAVTYFFAGAAAFAAFISQLLSIRKLVLENTKLETAISGKDSLIQIATFEQTLEFGLPHKQGEKRPLLHGYGVDAAGAAAVAALVAAVLPSLIYIVLVALVLLAATEIFRQRAAAEYETLVETLRTTIRASSREP